MVIPNIEKYIIRFISTNNDIKPNNFDIKTVNLNKSNITRV